MRVPEDLPVDFATAQEEGLRANRQAMQRALPPCRSAGSGSGRVGFLMAVFRKRLASSFAPFQKSLERRKALMNSSPYSRLSDVSETARLFEVDVQEDEGRRRGGCRGLAG